MKLNHSRVHRKGVTLRFSLPSKGGGNTDILVIIGDEDLRRILNGIGTNMPNLADAFTGSAHEAVSQLLLQSHIARTFARTK
jgi:hypothetical protein